MQISVKKFKSGERYVLLLDDDGVPDFWVTHFVTQRLRMDKAATSIEQYLKDIKHLKLWESINNRDLLEEIYQGKVPSRKDLDDLKEHCTYKAKALKVNSKSNVVDMSKFHLSTTEDMPTVRKPQYINRVTNIAEFLHFVGQERVKHKATSAKLFAELDQMKKLLKRGLSRVRLRKFSLDKTGIPDGAFEDFIEVAKPRHIYNPFKNPVVKIRNYLIIQTLYESGLRCSELLALQIGDISSDIDDPRLFVERRHDNKDDPRLRQPTAKTLGRGVPISSELRELLYIYIKQHRTQTKIAKTHPYIFVSHKAKKGSYETGAPIVQRTVNDLFAKIVAINPERFIHITPHSYRHFFNDQLSAQIDEEKRTIKEEVKRLEKAQRYEEAKQYGHENTITEQRELEIRAELNGHSSLESGRYYLKRTAKRQATRIRNKMHEALKHKVERVDDGK